MKIDGKEYSRKEVERRVGTINQLGGTTQYQFSEGRAKGVSGVEFNTGTGFSFTVMPDRGLDIADQSENTVGAKWLLLMLSTASATGIAMCDIAVAVVYRPESVHGYEQTCSGPKLKSA